MEWLLFWFAASVVIGIIAGSRGRSGFGWFALSLFVSPILTLILVVALPSIKPNVDSSGQAITESTHVRCPDCRELVRADARKCKHCGTALTPVATLSAAVKVQCRQCLKHNPGDLAKCANCGTSLRPAGQSLQSAS